MALVPDLVKSLPVDKALDDDIIVAYEMNGQPLPMLNGFPARLIVRNLLGEVFKRDNGAGEAV